MRLLTPEQIKLLNQQLHKLEFIKTKLIDQKVKLEVELNKVYSLIEALNNATEL